MTMNENSSVIIKAENEYENTAAQALLSLGSIFQSLNQTSELIKKRPLSNSDEVLSNKRPPKTCQLVEMSQEHQPNPDTLPGFVNMAEYLPKTVTKFAPKLRDINESISFQRLEQLEQKIDRYSLEYQLTLEEIQLVKAIPQILTDTRPFEDLEKEFFNNKRRIKDSRRREILRLIFWACVIFCREEQEMLTLEPLKTYLQLVFHHDETISTLLKPIAQQYITHQQKCHEISQKHFLEAAPLLLLLAQHVSFHNRIIMFHKISGFYYFKKPLSIGGNNNSNGAKAIKILCEFIEKQQIDGNSLPEKERNNIQPINT